MKDGPYRELSRVYEDLDVHSIRGQAVTRRERELKRSNRFILFLGAIAAVIETIVLFADGFQFTLLPAWLVITVWLLRQNRRALREAYVSHIEAIEAELYGHTRLCSDPFEVGCNHGAEVRYNGVDYCYKCHGDYQLGLRFPMP